MSRFVLAAALLGATAFSSTASAQDYSLVGIWSSTGYMGNGQAFASFWMSFGEDGSIAQRFMVSGGITDYVGQYGYDPASGTLQYVLNDYYPKFSPPTVPLGMTFTTTIEWIGERTIIFYDGTGAMEFHKQF